MYTISCVKLLYHMPRGWLLTAPLYSLCATECPRHPSPLPPPGRSLLKLRSARLAVHALREQDLTVPNTHLADRRVGYK